ncbi:reverse transcriptase domain-containing protein [Tanacetum coccineum]
MVVTAGSGDKKQYGGSRPLCSRCNYHHEGPCAPKCYKCNKFGHIARDCRGAGNANNFNNQKGTRSGQKPTCFECGVQGHFKKECPRMKNNKGNRGNQAGNDRAPAKVYVVGNAGANPDNVIAGTFFLNNRYAYILFDTGADQSFVSTAFSSQIDITPSTLDYYYDVELADGRIIGLNTILKGCTLNFLNHQFNVNLMPVELGSFDAIIGMDWLAKYQAVIVCAEKIVRIYSEGIHVDPAKIESIKALDIPKSPTGISSFLSKRCAVNQSLQLPEGSEISSPYCDPSKKVGAELTAEREKVIFASRIAKWNYDCDIRLSPGKANVVADALSSSRRPELKGPSGLLVQPKIPDGSGNTSYGFCHEAS